MNTHSDSRDPHFDLLKAIGLLCITLAHCQPNALIFQMRNFDVILLVLVSAMLFRATSADSVSVLDYFVKRLRRLLIPAWKFLALLFGYHIICAYLQHTPFPSIRTILEFFTLNGESEGNGLWIFRVFLLMSLIAPILLRGYKALSLKKYFLLLVLFYFAYAGLSHYVHPGTRSMKYLVNRYLFFLMGYGGIFAIGMALADMRQKDILNLSFCSLMVYAVIAGVGILKTGSYMPTQVAKYPPKIYYLSYGLGVSLLIYSFVSHLSFSKEHPLAKIASFISRYSLQLYLWQAFPLLAGAGLHPLSWVCTNHSVFNYAVLCFFSFLMLFLQLGLYRLFENIKIRIKKERGSGNPVSKSPGFGPEKTETCTGAENECGIFRKPFEPVLKTSFLKCAPDSQVEVHSLVSHAHLFMYILSIKSFLRFYDNVSVVVHDDGTLDKVDTKQMAAQIRGIRIIKNSEASEKVNAILEKYPSCRKFRNARINQRQVFDFAIFAKTNKLVMLDSDTLFLKYPEEIASWMGSENQQILYAYEETPWGPLVEGKPVTDPSNAGKTPFKFARNLCSGFVCYYKDMLDLELIEEYCTYVLKNCKEERDSFFAQAIVALCAGHSKYVPVLLPKSYQNPPYFIQDPVFRHYWTSLSLKPRHVADAQKVISQLCQNRGDSVLWDSR